MNHWKGFCFFLVLAAVLTPLRSPAPLIYSPGEGWHYEPVGEKGSWQRSRGKEQLQVAEEAFSKEDYTIALRAARRILRLWPQSDYAPRAEYLLGRCLEIDGKNEEAFKAYQHIIEKYPKSAQYNEILWRQFAIAEKFLNGEKFMLWKFIPYTSMEKTADMFGTIVASGPYGETGPHSQLNIGAANEKQKEYAAAVRAYNVAADRYNAQPLIAADAMYRAGVAWEKQAEPAEYDQNTASQAIAAYTDFIVLFPEDKRVAAAQSSIARLKAEKVRSSFEIAKFYEKSRKWTAAIIYYDDVRQLDPNSPLAEQARQRVFVLKQRLLDTPAPVGQPAATSK